MKLNEIIVCDKCKDNIGSSSSELSSDKSSKNSIAKCLDCDTNLCYYCLLEHQLIYLDTKHKLVNLNESVSPIKGTNYNKIYHNEINNNKIVSLNENEVKSSYETYNNEESVPSSTLNVNANAFIKRNSINQTEDDLSIANISTNSSSASTTCQQQSTSTLYKYQQMQKQQLLQRQIQLQQFQYQQQQMNADHLKQIKQQQQLYLNTNQMQQIGKNENSNSISGGTSNICNNKILSIENEIKKTYNFYLQILNDRKDYLIKELNTIKQFALINQNQNLNKQLNVQYQLELKKQQLENDIESEVKELKLILSPNKTTIKIKDDENNDSNDASTKSEDNETTNEAEKEEKTREAQPADLTNLNAKLTQLNELNDLIIFNNQIINQLKSNNPLNSIEFLSNFSAIQTSIRNTFGYIRINQNNNQVASNGNSGLTTKQLQANNLSITSDNTTASLNAANLTNYNYFKSNIKQQQQFDQSILNFADLNQKTQIFNTNELNVLCNNNSTTKTNNSLITSPVSTKPQSSVTTTPSSLTSSTTSLSSASGFQHQKLFNNDDINEQLNQQNHFDLLSNKLNIGSSTSLASSSSSSSNASSNNANTTASTVINNLLTNCLLLTAGETNQLTNENINDNMTKDIECSEELLLIEQQQQDQHQNSQINKITYSAGSTGSSSSSKSSKSILSSGGSSSNGSYSSATNQLNGVTNGGSKLFYNNSKDFNYSKLNKLAYSNSSSYLYDLQNPNSNGFNDCLYIDTTTGNSSSTFGNVNGSGNLAHAYSSKSHHSNASSSSSNFYSSNHHLSNSASSSTHHISSLTSTIPYPRSKMIYHCKFGEFGISDGQFTEPSGVTINTNNDIIVADTNSHRIQIFDKDGRFKFKFGECGKRDGQLLYPNRVSIVKQTGDIVVTERSPTHQIQIYNKYGQFMRKFGANILQHPRGVCVDYKGRIVVVECKVMRVLIFDIYGNVLQKFNCSKYLEFPNGVCCSNPLNGCNSNGEPIREEIYISDNRAHCIKVFDYNGNFIRQIGCEGLTNYPIGVGINSNNEILVADNHNNFNLTVFSQDGKLINALESKVKHAQCFDVGLMDDGSIVLASKDYRIYVYKYVTSVNPNNNNNNNNTSHNGLQYSSLRSTSSSNLTSLTNTFNTNLQLLNHQQQFSPTNGPSSIHDQVNLASISSTSSSASSSGSFTGGAVENKLNNNNFDLFSMLNTQTNLLFPTKLDMIGSTDLTLGVGQHEHDEEDSNLNFYQNNQDQKIIDNFELFNNEDMNSDNQHHQQNFNAVATTTTSSDLNTSFSGDHNTSASSLLLALPTHIENLIQ